MAVVYLHRRNDIQDPFKNVFYVGIGKRENRAYDKGKYNRSSFWVKIVEKCGYSVEITHKDLCIEEALSIEKYLISFYGRRNLGLGNLCNLTDGGEGCINYKFTNEQIERRREIAKEVNNREGAREKMSIALKKATSSLERREKMSKIAKEYSNKLEVKNKKSLSAKLMHKNPEFKEKHRTSVKKALSDPIVRKKMSDGNKIANSRPEVKEKNKLILRNIIENKDLLNKRNKSIKEAWKNKVLHTIAILECHYPKCKKEFEQKRSFQKYCSYSCGKKHHKLKKCPK